MLKGALASGEGLGGGRGRGRRGGRRGGKWREVRGGEGVEEGRSRSGLLFEARGGIRWKWEGGGAAGGQRG